MIFYCRGYCEYLFIPSTPTSNKKATEWHEVNTALVQFAVEKEGL